MKGIITKGVGGLYYVRSDKKVYTCKARGKFRYDGLTPAIGDYVEINPEDSNESSGVIEKIYERKTELIRPVVANVSQAFVVFTFRHPDLNLELLYRFLVLCEYNNLKITVCFNKMDLAQSDETDKIAGDILSKCGYNVIYMEAKNNKGLDELKDRIANNISVFCGPSGVGKSTILNGLIGREFMETGSISEKLKRGKHTTRHSELVQCGEGLLVDTPGFSSLDMDFIKKEDLKHCFPEFESIEETCKFNNCNHNKEPGCKIKEAVENGSIHKSRYDFYIKTLEEINSRGNWK